MKWNLKIMSKTLHLIEGELIALDAFYSILEQSVGDEYKMFGKVIKKHTI